MGVCLEILLSITIKIPISIPALMLKIKREHLGTYVSKI